MKLLSLFSGCGGMDIGFEGNFLCLSKSINTVLHPDWIKARHGDMVIVQPAAFETVFANLTDLSGLSELDTSEVTSMTGLFDGAPLLTSLKGLESWDVSKVENFDAMFQCADKLTDVSAIQNWNLSSMKDCYKIFTGCPIEYVPKLEEFIMCGFEDYLQNGRYLDWNANVSHIWHFPVHPNTEAVGAWDENEDFIPAIGSYVGSYDDAENGLEINLISHVRLLDENEDTVDLVAGSRIFDITTQDGTQQATNDENGNITCTLRLYPGWNSIRVVQENANELGITDDDADKEVFLYVGTLGEMKSEVGENFYENYTPQEGYYITRAMSREEGGWFERHLKEMDIG